MFCISAAHVAAMVAKYQAEQEGHLLDQKLAAAKAAAKLAAMKAGYRNLRQLTICTGTSLRPGKLCSAQKCSILWHTFILTIYRIILTVQINRMQSRMRRRASWRTKRFYRSTIKSFRA